MVVFLPYQRLVGATCNLQWVHGLVAAVAILTCSTWAIFPPVNLPIALQSGARSALFPGAYGEHC